MFPLIMGQKDPSDQGLRYSKCYCRKTKYPNSNCSLVHKFEIEEPSKDYQVPPKELLSDEETLLF